MSDNKNVIELKFGVSGGGKISGESGRQILQDIQSIAKEINESGVMKLKFSLDTDSIEKEVQSTNKKITKSITQDSGKFLRAYNQLYKYMDRKVRSKARCKSNENVHRTQWSVGLRINMVCSTPGMSEQSLILSTDNLFVVRSRSVRAAVGDRRKND